MDEYLAIIKIFGGNFAPSGWAMCQGQLLQISQNSALFSLLSTTYGGDGVQTFALPDLRGRTPIGFMQGRGLSNYNLGQVGGSEQNSLLLNNMPPHNHAVTGSVQPPVNSDATNSDSPEATFLGPSNTNAYNSLPSPGVFGGKMSVDLQTAVAGSGQPVNNIQPYLAVNYIICTQGLYPSRP